jgi:hypothetical protein
MTRLRRNLVSRGFLATLACVGIGFAAPPARGAELCVGGPKQECFSAIQAAIDAASDGDVIRVAAGTYEGGITITKSVQLRGAGARATTIEGGGPVITISQLLAVSKPTVLISGVTVTGGLNNSQPSSFFAAGGGVWIPEAVGGTTGATVTIINSVITRNRVTPETPLPLCGHLCAFASGGGIANAGTLTVTNTRITDNIAGARPTDVSLASDAVGGGIRNHHQGTLTLRQSLVKGNRAAVTAPNGMFAEAGGIADDGVLVIEDGVVAGNVAEAATAVPSSFPFDVRQEAVGGGIRISSLPTAAATIRGTTISDNSVRSSNVGGDAQATSGGIDDDGSLLLVDSRVVRNRVVASVPASSGYLAGAVFGGIEVQGTATIRNSSILGNLLHATSTTGAANAAGGGIGNLSGHVTLERTRVIGNRATATGIGGLALGGGIVNIAFAGGAPELALTSAVVTANALTASPGITIRGGGMYTADIFSGEPFPVTLTRTAITGNRPDQCFGC